MKKSALCFIFLMSFGLNVQAQLGGHFTVFEDFGSKVPNKRELKAWRNETVILPFILDVDSTETLSFQLKTVGRNISAEVMQLHLVEGDISAGNCGNNKKNGKFVKEMFPDRAEILEGTHLTVNSNKAYGLVKIQIPNNLKSGKYPIKLMFEQNQSLLELEAILHIINRDLPDFEKLNYNIDFWQFPLSISTYYNLEPYSPDHWKQIAVMFDQLNDLNQTTVTTSVFYDLYNGSVKPLEQMMIQVRKKADDTYSYDYTTFEKYVELAASKGVSKNIAVHNLFPWNQTYFYYDEVSGAVKKFTAAPGTKAYEDFWKPFLIDFASFLKSKGWMDKTVFWVDERDINTTALLFKYVKSIEPSYKFGYAGRFSPGLSERVYDYSLALNIVLTPDQLAARKSKGYKTTFYTSCFDRQPNMLMASNYSDIYFLVMLSRARGYDGMLRWAFNLWSSQIMTSAIFSDIPSGDSHFVYPQGQVSLRYLILQDALEEIQKAEAKSRIRKTKELLNLYNRTNLLKNEKERINMVNTMKNYLND